MKVGVRELRNNLSRYLDRVNESGEVVVTEHGRAVAKLVPLKGDVHPSGLDELIAEGAASPPRRADRSLPGDLIPSSAPVSSLVADQRR